MSATGIRLLTNFADRDLVTDVLRSVTLKTVVFGRAELRAPWGLHVDLPGRAVFHIVLRGEGWYRVNRGQAVPLKRGDTILFPQADPHEMNDHPETPIRPLQELLVKHPMTADRRFCYGGKGALTTMLCGAFQLDDPKLNLMGMLLPPLLHIRGDSKQLRALLGCIETELRTSKPGEQAIVTRMAEAFLIRAIRDHVTSSNGKHGLAAVLTDPAVSRALALIHERPDHSWTVAVLAKEANLSRSAFAARFKLCVGTPPLSYLQRYRFHRAVQLLQGSDAKLQEIAGRVGYDSESSFSKAFKRLMGKSPGAFRSR